MRVKLGEVCDINPKIQVTDDHVEVSFVPMQNVSEDGIIYLSETRLYGEVKKGFTSFHNGDVLFAKITPCMENGKGGIVKNLKNGLGFGSTEFHVLRPHSDIVLSDWLYYLTSWPVFRKECEKNMTGSAGQKRVPKSFLEEYKLFLPPLETQRHIAAVLDKVSALIALRRQQLDKLDELIKARFVEMFGDPMMNPHNLPKVILGSVLTIEPQNGLYKPQSDYVFDGTGVPILRIDSFYDGRVSNFSSLKRLICSEIELKRYSLYENDIVINRVNSIEYLGKCGLIRGLVENTVFESNMMRLHVDEHKFHPVYITKLLCSQFIYQQILKRAKKAVNQASINQKDVQSFIVYMPSMERQEQFAAIVDQTEKTKAAVQQALEKLETMKKALMQEYFGGEV